MKPSRKSVCNKKASDKKSIWPFGQARLPLGLLLAMAPCSLSAAIIPVTTNTDSGAGSLRAAMTAAMTNDTIDATAIANQTIILTSGNLPSIAASVTITGANITVNQGGLYSAFTITNTGDIVNNLNLINAPTPPPADTTVANVFNFTGNTLQLVNLNTAGNTILQTTSSVTGTATVTSTGTLTVDDSTINILDTFGSTVLQNSASVTGAATVEVGGELDASNSSLTGPLIDMGTVTLTNTPVTGNVSVATGASFTGSGMETVLGSLTNNGSTNTFLQSNASVTGDLIATAGTTTLGISSVAGNSQVAQEATLTASNSTLNTLDTFGTTTLNNGSLVQNLATVETTGVFTSNQSGISSLSVAGTAQLLNISTVAGSTTILSTGTLTVNNSTLNTLDTFGTTTLQNFALVAGNATVELGGVLNSSQSSIDSLINAGSAQLGNNSNISGATTVLSTGTFTVDHSTLNTLDTFGVTRLQNASQITGTTTVEAGGTITATDSFLAGAVQDFGTINFFHTALTNNLTIAQNAAFNGDSTSSITGLVTNAGIMRYNGQVVGNVQNQPTGSLSGTAKIQGTLTNNGLVSPGISGSGSITATTYVQNNSATFEAMVTPSSSGSILSTTAQLDGALFVNLLPGSYTSPKNYTILQATGPLTGTFSSASVSSPALMQVLYFPHEVRLQVVPESALNLFGNAQSAAQCILQQPILLPQASDQAVVRNSLLQLRLDEFQSAFNQMQPSQYSALTWVQLTNILQLQQAVFRHFPLWQTARNFGGCPTSLPNLPDPESCSSVGKPLANLQQSPCCFTPTSCHSWINLAGSVQRQTGIDSQYGYIDRGLLVQLGMDSSWDNTALGITGAYQFDRLDWDKHAGHSTMNSGYAGVYAVHAGRHYVVDFSCLFGYTGYSTARDIHFPGLSRSAKTSFHSYEGLVGLGLGSFNTLCGFEWIPFSRLDYCYLSQPSFCERKAESLNLRIGNYAASLVQLELGVLFEKTWTLECGLLNPKMKLSYVGQYSPQHKHWNANFRDIPSCRFSVSGWSYNRNLFAPNLACTFYRLGRQVAVEVGYDAQIGSNYWSQQAYVQMDWKF